MADKRFDYLIIGSGFAGLSVAWYLLRQQAGSVCLIEKEAGAGLAASGRNAGMICQLVRDPFASEIMVRSTQLMKETWLRQFSQVSFSQCGSLHVGQGADMDALETSRQNALSRDDVTSERLTRRETIARFPFLNHTEFDQAVYCPSDGVLNIHALAEALLQNGIENGLVFMQSLKAEPVTHAEGFAVETGAGDVITGKILVNAAGAWAQEVAESAGAQSITAFPLRRHVYLTAEDPLPGMQVQDWPIVWDMAHEIYFRPMQKALMLSPCDEALQRPGPSRVHEEAQILLAQKLRHFLPDLSRTTFVKSWSGLRTFSADRRFVVGWDKKQKNFFWLAFLGGYGMTSAAALGKMASEMLSGKSVHPGWEAAFSPSRFSESRFVAIP